MFKIEEFETRLMASTTIYPVGWKGEMPQAMSTGKKWGPFSWGVGEFGSWFGVGLPTVYILPARVWDRPLIQEGFYGVTHSHS